PGELLTNAALVTVSGTSRTALTEIRRILGAMHESDGSYHPAPGLRDVGGLAAELTEAGLPVEVRSVGTPQGVPSALEMTAYRLTQEALTNAAKHAGRTHATVTIRYEPGAVHIEILDDGPADDATPDTRASAPGETSPGHGLLGMRERVAVWGGTLEAGPRQEGGYAVRAGASGFLPKDTAPDGLLRAVAQGRSNAEIAADLVVSYATVKTHVRHSMEPRSEPTDGYAADADFICLVVRPHFIAIAMVLISSPYSGPKRCAPTMRSVDRSTRILLAAVVSPMR
ncbi:MAG: ATP-binding protein, partial [Demequina sp.]|nr:ATP-binding protein [Demequina sp.]